MGNMGNFPTNRCLCLASKAKHANTHSKAFRGISYLLCSVGTAVALCWEMSTAAYLVRLKTSSCSRSETGKLGRSRWKEQNVGVPLLWGLLSGVLLC